ncbi:DUF4232 domain-containing protein [Phycicoccus sp. Soil748]|uniref:DUF4232 domain-containing protein n=1 Tax=Phycicoccus sp. Soil748 TaxID=1736397 RepID=UPI0007037FCD|nr:DUF4232 domain-containing protein [Phycicoccus sp. Soil748]KRE54537.1 hypothetical protein ASG70_10190 [Phycicoccus sp. Soil748]
MQSWGRWLGRGVVVAAVLLLLVVAWKYEAYSTVFGETACKRDARLCDDAANRLAQRELGRWMLGATALLGLGLVLVAARRVVAPRSPAMASGHGLHAREWRDVGPALRTGLVRHVGVAALRGVASAAAVVVLSPFWLFGGTALYCALALGWFVLLAWLLDRSHRVRAPGDGDLGSLLVSGAAATVGVGSGVVTAVVLPQVVPAPVGASWFALEPVVLAAATGLGAGATVLAARLLSASTTRRLDQQSPTVDGHGTAAVGAAPTAAGGGPVVVAAVVAMVTVLLVTATPWGRGAARAVRDDLYPRVQSAAASPPATAPDGNTGKEGPTPTGPSPVPAPTSEAPEPAPVVADRPCVDGDLTLSARGWDSAMGSSAVSVVATNTSATACWVRGYPALRLEQGGRDLSLVVTPSPTRRSGAGSVVPDRRVGLAARGGEASFDLWWRGYRQAADQRTPQTLVVTPPGTGAIRLGLSAPYLLDVVEGAEVTVLRWSGPPTTSR